MCVGSYLSAAVPMCENVYGQILTKLDDWLILGRGGGSRMDAEIERLKNLDRWTPAEFSMLAGVSVRTLKRWHDSGKLVANVLPSGRRFYTRSQYDACFGTKGGDA